MTLKATKVPGKFQFFQECLVPPRGQNGTEVLLKKEAAVAFHMLLYDDITHASHPVCFFFDGSTTYHSCTVVVYCRLFNLHIQ